MSSVIITHLILQYRYWILVPLCFIEGPIVAFVAGALTPLGYFNIYLLCIIFFCRDIIVDVSMYALGRFGGQTRFASWLLSKIGVTEEHLNSVHRLWDMAKAAPRQFTRGRRATGHRVEARNHRSTG